MEANMIKYFSENQVEKVRFGRPFPTESIILNDFHEKAFETDHLFKATTFKATTHLTIAMDIEDCVYGLGENLRGINKRGYQYVSFCTDEPKHMPGKTALYAAHNFFIVHSRDQSVGYYIDFAGKITYDIGFTNQENFEITVEGTDFDVYIYRGTPNEIVTSFRKSIGQSYVPPIWGFGYQQSRWSYENMEIVENIADGFDQYDIPCDAIYLDIDYMERFKDFTISQRNFPEFESFNEKMLARDIKLIPIIDAGVKIEQGYDVYDEGLKNSYFCTDESGEPFVAAVWPGKVHFPDFLNPDVRKWFGEKYHGLMKKGIQGFWNDMNEPAVFYSEKGLRELFIWLKEHENTNMDIYSFFEMTDRVARLSNADEDYKSMYHNIEGKRISHYDVHNLYGYFMTRAADEGFKILNANQRMLLITRASHVGMAKHSGIWTGDNHSWWEHLKLNIQMMPSLNMVGFLYAGADTGGFQDNVSPELMVRWMQFSLFTPLLRNHSAMGTRNQEPWRFEGKVKEHIRNLIRLRYSMIPFLYSEFMKASITYGMMFKPLSFEYEDEASKRVEDQLLVGDSLMLAPVYEQNAVGRFVYLPEEMLLWRATAYEDISEEQFQIYDSGYHYIKATLEELLIFIRPDKLLPLVAPKNRVNRLNRKSFVLLGFTHEVSEYELYVDDGITFDYKNHNKYELVKIEAETDGKCRIDQEDYSIQKSFIFRR